MSRERPLTTTLRRRRIPGGSGRSRCQPSPSLPKKRPFRSTAGFSWEPGPSRTPIAQAEVAFVVPMRFEVFWTVPGGRSVGTRALDLEGELARRGIPLPEEIDVTPST